MQALSASVSTNGWQLLPGETAVIPDRVEMSAPSRWTCALWL